MLVSINIEELDVLRLENIVIASPRQPSNLFK